MSSKSTDETLSDPEAVHESGDETMDETMDEPMDESVDESMDTAESADAAEPADAVKSIDTVKKPSDYVTVLLGPVHSAAPYSPLPSISGFEAVVVDSKFRPPVPFRTFIDLETSENMVLQSFFEEHIQDRVTDGFMFVKIMPSTVGISEIRFKNAEGQNVDYKVHGVSLIHFTYEGHYFLVSFIVVDHLFEMREFEKQFPVVLGMRFLVEGAIKSAYSDGTRRPLLPPVIKDDIDVLALHINGCCLYKDLTDSEGQKRTIARAAYGVYCPLLPPGWEFSQPLADTEPQSNQRAELTAIIRGLWHVRTRCIRCNAVRVCTDSKYVVDGFYVHLPRWRENGYRNTKKKEVANASLWKEIESGVIHLRRLVRFCLIDRKANQVADRLAKEAAQEALNELVARLPGGDPQTSLT